MGVDAESNTVVGDITAADEGREEELEEDMRKKKEKYGQNYKLNETEEA